MLERGSHLLYFYATRRGGALGWAGFTASGFLPICLPCPSLLTRGSAVPAHPLLKTCFTKSQSVSANNHTLRLVPELRALVSDCWLLLIWKSLQSTVIMHLWTFSLSSWTNTSAALVTDLCNDVTHGWLVQTLDIEKKTVVKIRSWGFSYTYEQLTCVFNWVMTYSQTRYWSLTPEGRYQEALMNIFKDIFFFFSFWNC